MNKKKEIEGKWESVAVMSVFIFTLYLIGQVRPIVMEPKILPVVIGVAIGVLISGAGVQQKGEQ